MTRNKDSEAKKLCIELDEKMQEKWNWTKEDLKEEFEFVEDPIPITDSLVFQCLLYCYEEEGEALPSFFVDKFRKKSKQK